MAYMYILECGDGTFYTGSTKDLEKRLWEHANSLGANYTKKRHPLKLVYHEEYSRIDEAFYREKQVQGWSRKKKKMLIEKCYDKLPAFSTAYRDKINLDSKIHIEPSVNLITESKVVEALETTRNNQ